MLGVAAAGLAFAMQEVIGALAGWVNVLSGRIFRAGDRIEMGGVRGDVIDLTPLRTKLIEIGSASDPHDTWVRGWQPTGRVVSISNKKTFTEPVFNFSANLDFIWQEISVPVSYDDDWRTAERILEQETMRISDSESAREAVHRMAGTTRSPVSNSSLEAEGIRVASQTQDVTVRRAGGRPRSAEPPPVD